ncbi:MAG: hypothetical protein SF182_21245 [Deltaproteobacteria bacterium]|nr:hypothetical protein [Deltaproteobacteria bacterium]
MRIRAALPLAALTLLAACGDPEAPGTVNGSIEPCDDGEPSFDVWQADFAPNGRTTLSARVDTRNSQNASNFRLVVACGDTVVIDTTDGTTCSERPPGGDPDCPLAAVDLGSLASQSRVQCLAEIGPSAALGLGGACANAARADYALVMRIDDAALALDRVAHNCRAPSSCLQDDFDIDVDDDD